jgi:carboxylesterase type B
MAYGGKKPVPFQRAICQSQALEPGKHSSSMFIARELTTLIGIMGNFIRKAMAKLAAASGCNVTSLDSNATIACLRALSMDRLLQAQLDTHSSGPEANIGDECLPVVDGTFLPPAPSQLIDRGHLAIIPTMIG